MNKISTGRTLIALSVALGAIGSTIVDNINGPTAHMHAVQTWPPHALFHDAAMFLFLDGVSLIGLWLLFRRSREPLVGALVATLLVFANWTPFLYITTLFPQTSLAPASPVGLPYNASNFAQWAPAIQNATPLVLGVPIQFNALIGIVWMSIAAVGYWLFRKGIREGAQDSRHIA